MKAPASLLPRLRTMPARDRAAPWMACIMIAAATAGFSGCGFSAETSEPPAYLPTWPQAKSALDSALSAWQKSSTPMPESFDTPEVRFVDKQRRPGQTLNRFDILNRIDVQGARQFAVRLHLEGEDSPQLVRYNVLGKEPIWVFRLDDLEMFSHWEHDMTSEPTSK